MKEDRSARGGDHREVEVSAAVTQVKEHSIIRCQGLTVLSGIPKPSNKRMHGRMREDRAKT